MPGVHQSVCLTVFWTTHFHVQTLPDQDIFGTEVRQVWPANLNSVGLFGTPEAALSDTELPGGVMGSVSLHRWEGGVTEWYGMVSCVVLL